MVMSEAATVTEEVVTLEVAPGVVAMADFLIAQDAKNQPNVFSKLEVNLIRGVVKE